MIKTKKKGTIIFLALLFSLLGISLSNNTASASLATPIISKVEMPADMYGIGDIVNVAIYADGTGYTINNGDILINGVAIASDELYDQGDNRYYVYYHVVEGDTSVSSGAPAISVVLRKAGEPCAAFTTATVTGGTNVVIDPVRPDDPVVSDHFDPIDDSNKNNFSFSGTTGPNERVYWDMYDQRNNILSNYEGQLADGSGNFSFSGIDVSDLNDGTIFLYVWITDLAGNDSTSYDVSIDITKDTGAPMVTEENIAVVGTCSETDCIYGDNVKVTWDNSAAGDNNDGITWVSMDFSDIGGDESVAANDAGTGCDSVSEDDIWSACESIGTGFYSGDTGEIGVKAKNPDPTSVTVATPFTISNLGPELYESVPIASLTADNTPEIVVEASEAGTLAYGGSCSSATTTAVEGENTLTLNTLADGTYTNCTITLTNSHGVSSVPLEISEFEVDTTSPIITEVSDVNDGYSFNTDEDGEVVCSGTCTCDAYASVAGNPNQIIFDIFAPDGVCTIQVEDEAGNLSNSLSATSFFPTVNLEAPVASPEGGSYAYSQSVTITPPSGAVTTYYTLDGSVPDNSDTQLTGPITINLNSGNTVVLKAVSYDNQGNKGDIMIETYTHDSTSDAGDIMENAFIYGDITVEGGNPASTPKIIFNSDLKLDAGEANVTFPAGTEMTRTGGGDINMAAMIMEDITTILNNELAVDVAGAIKIGLPNLRLTFSKPIMINIPVGSVYDGQTLNIYFQSEGESGWSLETTCLVSSGICNFQTTHATKFVSSASDPSSDSDDHDGKNWKLYKKYKKEYKTKAKQKTYRQVKSFKKTNAAEFSRLKNIYASYNKLSNREMKKLSQKIQADFKIYENYRGYKLYLFYRDKVGE